MLVAQLTRYGPFLTDNCDIEHCVYYPVAQSTLMILFWGAFGKIITQRMKLSSFLTVIFHWHYLPATSHCIHGAFHCRGKCSALLRGKFHLPILQSSGKTVQCVGCHLQQYHLGVPKLASALHPCCSRRHVCNRPSQLRLVHNSSLWWIHRKYSVLLLVRHVPHLSLLPTYWQGGRPPSSSSDTASNYTFLRGLLLGLNLFNVVFPHLITRQVRPLPSAGSVGRCRRR
mmetsp:Transcript_37581/g.112656  ORF Transcript_37581/g.112656 Transcript_37581/m.112656 type:complete len:228 (-) Transcript_37581:244-927(-)